MFPSDNKLKSPIELLTLLTIWKEKSIHGFELIKKLDKFEYWKPTAGTVYPILDRLTERGLLEKFEESGETSRKKVTYSITKTGLEVLKDSIDILDSTMKFYEKIFILETDSIDKDPEIIDFIRKRFETYLNLLQNKKFNATPDNILKLDQLNDFINEEIKKFGKKLVDMKNEGNFVKIDIK